MDAPSLIDFHGAPQEPLGAKPWADRLNRLLDARMTFKRRNPSTAKADRPWIRRYIQFYGWRDPASVGVQHVTEFRSHLTEDQPLAASTQNQAFAGLLVLYGDLLRVELP